MVATLALALAALGPAAHADGHDTTALLILGGHGPRPAHPPGHAEPHGPDKPDKPGGTGDSDGGKDGGAGKPADTSHTDSDTDAHDPTATNGGRALPGDGAASLKDLTPTAPPITGYEMPFPCGEVWGGSSRAGHSPSPRAVDFNYAGGDQGRPVVAAAAGTVVTAVVGKDKPSYGQYVVVDHGNGESTLYAHLDSVLVAVGQPVGAGTQLGTVGETGNASGSHLHFEERLGGSVVDAWFHGALFPMTTSQTSANCGGAPVVVVNTTDVPLAGNMYGGTAAELMVYRKSAPAAFHITRTGIKERVIKIGAASDQPVLGDWDGNGRVDPGVRDPATREFSMQVKRHRTSVRFGKRTDVPIAGNWDGTGAWEVGVWRAKNAKFLLRDADGSKTKVRLGDPDDLPVTGDWNGDGVTDLGVYDTATATFTLLQKDGAGVAFTSPVVFGTPGDLPVTGDWDGDGITDLGVWSPTTATFTKRGAPELTGMTGRVKRLQWGRPSVG